MDPKSPEDIIESNAQEPRRASGDQGSMEQHSIPDQIEAAKFAAANRAAKQGGLPFRYVRVRPPGASGVDFNR